MDDSFSDPAERRRVQCQIRADIESALRHAVNCGAFRKVRCACADNTAILWGEVTDEASLQMAEHIALHVDNVASVVNRIQIDDSAEPYSPTPQSAGRVLV